MARLKNYTIPTPLKPGDKVTVVSPSGPVRELENVHRGIEIWQRRGYIVEMSEGWDEKYGYLSGSDQQRRNALAKAWQDPQVKAILCSRGGYGAMRLLEEYSWDEGVAKWLIGFSDITALLWSLEKRGIIGVHGPVLTTLALEPDWSIQRLFSLVEGKEIETLEGKGWGGGTATGRLLVGNLTVATALLGTRYQPTLEGVILGLEEVGESPYRLDRMLTQWRLSGLIQKVKGIALGRFSQCQGTLGSVEEVLSDRLGDLSIPIVSDLPFGHDGVNAALRVGAMVELDGDQGKLKNVLAGR